MTLRDEIFEFCKKLKINSKEKGVIPLWPLMPSQLYVLEEILSGIDQGIHIFVILKARQLGISTLCNALDVFWTHKYRGMQGTVVTEAEKTRDNFRNTITQFMANLPRELFIKPTIHNRIHLVLRNRSRLVYQVAGTKVSASSAALGQGEGITFMHATECASYADEEGLASLMSSLAETNPKRLYIFESTAKGFGLWSDICETAQQAISQKFIFVGWYRNTFYSFPEQSNEYRTYWDGNLTQSEKRWVREVEETEGYKIKPEQMAWYRWQLAEKQRNDEQYMQQNYPSTPEMAFQMTGSPWFHPEVLTNAYIQAKSTRGAQRFARFNFGSEFTNTELLNATSKTCDLTIWEPPVAGGHHVLGGDPAEGSSVNADDFGMEVFRCYADRIEQVAEYANHDINTYEYAWAMLSLCGAYRARYILEINGCGGAVYQEIKNVRRQAFSRRYMEATGQDKQMAGLRDAVKNIFDYYYQRIDMAGGKTNAVHWKTNIDNKRMMMALLRDLVTRGICVIRSERLVNQMRKIRRQDDGDIRADGKGKDDLVISAALACVAWYEDVRPQLMAMGHTKKHAMEMRAKGQGAPQQTTVLQLATVSYLQNAKIIPKPKRAA